MLIHRTLGSAIHAVAYHNTPPSADELEQAEELENRIKSDGRIVRTEHVSMEEAKKRFENEPRILQGLPRLETVRLVTIEGRRPMVCGGTHLRNVHEAKGVRIDRIERQEGGFRLYFDVL